MDKIKYLGYKIDENLRRPDLAIASVIKDMLSQKKSGDPTIISRIRKLLWYLCEHIWIIYIRRVRNRIGRQNVKKLFKELKKNTNFRDTIRPPSTDNIRVGRKRYGIVTVISHKFPRRYSERSCLCFEKFDKYGKMLQSNWKGIVSFSFCYK